MLSLLAGIAMLPHLTVALGVNETQTLPFGPSWGEAHAIGLRATTLTLDWNRIETSPGQFDLAFPKIANEFYPSQGAKIGLILRDLNTNRDERPPDMKGLRFTDSTYLQRWRAMATAVLDAMPRVKFSWIAVGNEVDAGLQPNSEAFTDYIAFLRSATDLIHDKRPGVPVGTPLTFEGTQKSGAWQRIAKVGDVTMVNYYLRGAAKMNVGERLKRDLKLMRRFAGARRLLLTEVGCPSGTLSGGSEAAQAEFYRVLFKELPRAKVDYVNICWMNDLGDQAKQTAALYGTQDAAFVDFLGSLGLRNAHGKPKPAWSVVFKALAP